MTESVLVSGGAGYIGSHTCKALSRAGLRPVTLDNLGLGHAAFVKWGPLVRGDIRDTDLAERTMRDHAVTSIIHFAAFAYVGESVTDPAKYYENNVIGTLSLLAAARRAGVDRFVFSSTCAVYGEPDRLPISETSPPNPVNPYGRSKLVCEGVLADYAAAYGLRHVALRYFNASGDDPDGEIGELRDPEPHLIPRAMMALQGHIDDFQVFGSDFPTEDGTAIRDYIHVVDLADAHVRALLHLRDGGPGGTFNLGVGQGYSVAEVLSGIGLATGRDIPAPRGPRRPGDPARLVADASLARKTLGFAPTHSDLDTIVNTAWAWHQRAHPMRTGHA